MGRRKKAVQAIPVKEEVKPVAVEVTETINNGVKQEIVDAPFETKVAEPESLMESAPETKIDIDSDVKVDIKPQSKPVDIKLVADEEKEEVKVQITLTPSEKLSKKILELKKNPKYKFLSKNILIRIAQRALGK